MTHSQGVTGVAVTRDGRRLYFQHHPGPSRGAAGPIVVFEGGLAASRSYWAPVQAAVARWAPSVVYDRSGLGRSAPDGRPRTLARLAGDLGQLLDHLGPGPFVLVGHSWGGPIVRIAAGADPARVAGLVLVDPTDESCDLVFARSTRRVERIGQVGSTLLARLGLLGFAYRGLLKALPEDARADMRAEGFTVAAMRTRGAELESVVADMTALRNNPPDLANTAVTVISAGRTSAGLHKRVREEVDASHQFRARQSAGGRHVYARESGHLVPIDEPELVAAEIRRFARVL